MNDWSEVKSYLKRRTEKVFSNSNQPCYDHTLEEAIDLFTKTVDYVTGEKTLDGLSLKLFNALYKLSTDGNRAEKLNCLKLIATSQEAYFKRVVNVSDPLLWMEIKKRPVYKQGFSVFVNELVNPNKYEFSNEIIDSLKGSSNFAEHVCRAYPLRNDESHESPLWDEVEVEQSIISVLVCYLYATFEKFDSLYEKVCVRHIDL